MDQSIIQEIEQFDKDIVIPPIQQYGEKTYKATIESLFFNAQNQKAIIQSNIALQNHETLRQFNNNKYKSEDHLLLALRSFQPEQQQSLNQLEQDSQQIQEPYLVFKIPQSQLPNLQKFARTYQFMNDIYQVMAKMTSQKLFRDIFSFPQFNDQFIFEVDQQTFTLLKNKQDNTKNKIIEDIILNTQDWKQFLGHQSDYRPRLQLPSEQGQYQLIFYQNQSDKVLSVRNDLNQTHVLNEDTLILTQDSLSQQRFFPANNYLDLYRDEAALEFIKYFSFQHNLKNAQNYTYVEKYFQNKQIADNPLSIFTYCLEFIDRARNIFQWEQIIQNYYQNYQQSFLKNDQTENNKEIKVTYYDVLYEIYFKYIETLTKQTQQKQFLGKIFDEDTFQEYCDKRLKDKQFELTDDNQKDMVLFDWRDKTITFFLIFDQTYYIGIVDAKEQVDQFKVINSSLSQQMIDLEYNYKRVYIYIKNNTDLYDILKNYKMDRFEQMENVKKLIDQIILEQAYKTFLQQCKNKILSKDEKQDVKQKIDIHINMLGK
ncbi:hypothetical protein pb186bvf_001034 [Paramecium bursaria]